MKNLPTGFKLYDENRELTNKEYQNLVKKSQNGFIPANYFRSHLFNSTSRVSKELKRKKIIYNDGKTIIKVNRSLHQRHRDLLSLIFTENRGVSQPDKTGKYYIYVNLYDLAKKMGYKSPSNSRINLKEFFDNLRVTDVEIIENGNIGNCTLLGSSVYNPANGFYMVEVPALTSQYHVLNWGVMIDPVVNREIIKIPNNLSRIKALVSYLVSNKPLKNGIIFNSLCEKLDITVKSRISEFKKEIIKNKELLAKFEIEYFKDSGLIKYNGIDLIKFERAITPKEIYKSLFDCAEDDSLVDLSKYTNKKALDDDNKLFIIKKLEKQNDKYLLYFIDNDSIGELEKDQLELLDRYIMRASSILGI